MRKARVLTNGWVGLGSGHSFEIGDIVEFVGAQDGGFTFIKKHLIQSLLGDEFEWLDNSDDFIVATIDGKRYKCFPMEDGE